MKLNIFQRLQAIEHKLLTKQPIHIHISLSPGSTGLTEGDVKQLMNDVESVQQTFPKWWVWADRRKPVAYKQISEALYCDWAGSHSKPKKICPIMRDDIETGDLIEVESKNDAMEWILTATKDDSQPAKHWPKWYVPVKPERSSQNKEVAYFRRDSQYGGHTVHTDGTSFLFQEWIDGNVREVTESEAKHHGFFWMPNSTPTKPGIWAFLADNNEVLIHGIRRIQHVWTTGNWCFLRPFPVIRHKH